MPDHHDPLTELLDTAKQQLLWQRAATLPQVRVTIEQTLTTSKHREAYEMSDGRTSARHIATVIGSSPASLSRWTQRWRELGIAFETDDGRIQHLVSLAALGLPLEVSA